MKIGKSHAPAPDSEKPGVTSRPHLVVFSHVIQEKAAHWAPGLLLTYKRLDSLPALIYKFLAIKVGDELDLKLKSFDMGHYNFALLVQGVEMRQFRSRIVGGLYERGEPLIARVAAASDEGRFRIDIILNRPVNPGERLPLLCPFSDAVGVSAQVHPPTDPRTLPGDGWHPTIAIPWHFFSINRYEKPKLIGKDELDQTLKISFLKGLVAIPKKRRNTYNPTPWKDLDPAAVAIQGEGKEIAHLLMWGEDEIQQLLNRGQRVEAEFVRTGRSFPGETFVNLSLVN